MEDENTMAYIKDIQVNIDNNCYLFKNNVDYILAKFIQASKILKRSIDMFFSNFNLASIKKQLSYKNVNKMQVLLTELQYNNVI